VEVPLIDDALYSGPTRFRVILSEPAGTTITGPETVEVRITDGEPIPQITMSPDVTVTEGDAGRHEVPMTVTVTGATRVPITAAWSVREIRVGNSPMVAEGTLTFAPNGPASQTIRVPYEANRTPEEFRAFDVSVSQVTGAFPRQLTRRVTVTDDDLAELTIVDATASESSDWVRVTIATTGVTHKPVSVRYTTMSGSAAEGSDFTAMTGTLHFTPSGSRQTVLVPMVHDSVPEGDEWFTVVLSDPVDATIRRAAATVVIVDDDSGKLPTISSGPVAVTEAGGSFAQLSFRLSYPVAADVRFRAETVAGSATATEDFVPKSQVVVIPAGWTGTFFSVSITPDAIAEGAETFTVAVTPVSGVSIATPSIPVTILDNDEPPPAPVTVVVGDIEVTEGDAGTTPARFSVFRSPTSAGSPLTIAYSTADGVATAPDDYSAVSGLLTFAPGETMKIVEVAVKADHRTERDETFKLVLGNGDTGVCRVLNDDDLPGKGRSARH
jgi:chitinase